MSIRLRPAINSAAVNKADDYIVYRKSQAIESQPNFVRAVKACDILTAHGRNVGLDTQYFYCKKSEVEWINY